MKNQITKLVATFTLMISLAFPSSAFPLPKITTPLKPTQIGGYIMPTVRLCQTCDGYFDVDGNPDNLVNDEQPVYVSGAAYIHQVSIVQSWVLPGINTPNQNQFRALEAGYSPNTGGVIYTPAPRTDLKTAIFSLSGGGWNKSSKVWIWMQERGSGIRRMGRFESGFNPATGERHWTFFTDNSTLTATTGFSVGYVADEQRNINVEVGHNGRVPMTNQTDTTKIWLTSLNPSAGWNVTGFYLQVEAGDDWTKVRPISTVEVNPNWFMQLFDQLKAMPWLRLKGLPQQ